MQEFLSNVLQTLRAGYAWVGEVPPHRAAVIFDNGIRPLRAEIGQDGFYKPSNFFDLAQGGQFVLVPRDSLPKAILWGVYNREDRCVTPVLPPGVAGWVKNRGLMAPFMTFEALDKGGRFELRRRGEFWTLPAKFCTRRGVTDGEVVDRYHDLAGAIPRWIFGKFPFLVAQATEKGFLFVPPPRKASAANTAPPPLGRVGDIFPA